MQKLRLAASVFALLNVLIFPNNRNISTPFTYIYAILFSVKVSMLLKLVINDRW